MSTIAACHEIFLVQLVANPADRDSFRDRGIIVGHVYGSGISDIFWYGQPVLVRDEHGAADTLDDHHSAELSSGETAIQAGRPGQPARRSAKQIAGRQPGARAASEF